jgi:uncharacterized membrane protein YdfJ with MMPL/SSD domain
MKKPMTVKIAMFSAKHRWLVLGFWFVAMMGLVAVSTAIPTTPKPFDPLSGFDFDSSKASKVFTENGQKADPYEDFFLVINHPTLKATEPSFQAMAEQITKDLAGMTHQNQPLFTLLVNPYQAPPQLKTVSSDGTTVRIYGQILGQTYSETLTKKLDNFDEKLKELRQKYSEYKILAYNQTLSFIEANQKAQESLEKSLLITLIPTFLILLMVFGAFVASVVPLILAMTAIMGTTGAILIYSRISGNTDITDATMLSVLMGLAVAVDYSLFVISRYRTERRNGHEKLKAIEIASGTAGRAVFFSGIIVAIAMSGLLFLGGALTPISIAIITVVMLSVIGSITFLPALLSILGNGINWGRIPYFGRAKSDETGIWAALVRWIMRHPVAITVVVSALLLALSSPLTHIKLGTSLLSNDNLEGTKAAKFMLEKWPEGTELKLEVVVTQADKPDTLAAIERFQTAALQIPGLGGPVVSEKSANGKIIRLYFTQPGSLNDASNQAVVTKLRNEVVPQYFKDLSGVEVYISGNTAIAVDFAKFFTNPAVWVFVLTLSFLVLLLVFRSLVIAIKAILLNLLSTGAAYGVVILVFQDGILWIKPTGYMESFLPVFMFTIIFGLSMDYHLFILTRIKEFRDKGLNSNEAVARGIASTSGTITGAAAIMVIVFGDFFIAIDNSTIQQLGLGLAVAIFLDATVVRSMLLPAVMKLMGEFNWWMPRFLNWLPTITIEVEEEEANSEKKELETSANSELASTR